MRVRFCAVAVALAAFVAGAPSVERALKVKESVAVPRGWTKRGEAPREMTIDLRIALPQSNFALLEKHLYEIR